MAFWLTLYRTTTGLGSLTAKSGSAVSMSQNVWYGVVTSILTGWPD